MSIGLPNLPGLPRLPGLPGGNNGLPLQGPALPDLGGDADRLPPLPPGIAAQTLERGFDGLPPGLARQLGVAGRNAPAVSPPPASSAATPAPNFPVAPVPPNQASPVPLASPAVPASTPSTPASPIATLTAAVNQVVASVANAMRGTVTSPAATILPNAGPNAAPTGALPAAPNAGPIALPRGAPNAVPTALPNAAPTNAAPTNTVPNAPPNAVATAPPTTAPVTAPLAANTAAPLANTAQAPPAAGLPTPARADAAPVPQRADPSLLERLAGMLRPGGTTQTAAQAPSTLPVAGATQTLTLMAVPLLLVPPSQSPADARGITLLAVNDRAGVQRPDVMLAGIYTADGPQRRFVRRGANVLPARLSRWLIALGLGGAQTANADADPEVVLSAAMQWLFWLLAVIAYACLGLALIALLPAGSDVLRSSGRAWTGGFAVAGLVAAAGAWWFARQLSARNPPDASSSGDKRDAN